LSIQSIETWAGEHQKGLGESGIQLSWFRGPEDRQPASIVINFESLDHSGRLVVWSDGQAQLNAGNLRTSEILLDEYRRNIDDLGVADAVSTIVALLQ
jgi:hypothetical protein